MKKKQKWFFLVGMMVFTYVAAFGSHVLTSQEAMAAEPPPVKVAVILPLSGAFSRTGNLYLQSVKAMMNMVNDRGGIKSLGGAKLVPVVGDALSTVEGAASATERICRDPEILLAHGCWASSLTMASTEVTERMGIPHFTISVAAALSNRGFKYGFYLQPSFDDFIRVTLPITLDMFKKAGKEIKTAFVATSNNVSDLSWCDNAQKYLEGAGVKFVGREVWPLGSLTDATPIMQKIKSTKPDAVLYGGSALPEIQLFAMKQKELGMESVPFVCSGAWLGDPSLLPHASTLQSWIGNTPAWPFKTVPKEWVSRILEQCKKEYSNEPYAAYDLSLGMVSVPVYAEILERAASRDRNVIRETAKKLDIHNVEATRGLPGQGMAFDEKNKIVQKYQVIAIYQWQGNKCVVVSPPNLADAKVRLKK
jgi:branched-chain amino acid transport system substrate-binding protein